MGRILILTVSCFCLMAASAVAQGPVGDAYGGAGSVTSGVAGATGGGSTTPGNVVVTPPIVTPPNVGSGDTVGAGAVGAGGGAVGTGAGTENTTASPVAAAAAKQDLRGDSLPFTGFDVILMLTGAAGLLAAGMGMRRLSRRPI
jgi:hypothetical protein